MNECSSLGDVKGGGIELTGFGVVGTASVRTCSGWGSFGLIH